MDNSRFGGGRDEGWESLCVYDFMIGVACGIWRLGSMRSDLLYLPRFEGGEGGAYRIGGSLGVCYVSVSGCFAYISYFTYACMGLGLG